MMELECDLSKIQSEELLRKMWQQSEDVNRKKEIRSQLYKLRESRLRDLYQYDAMSDNRVAGFGKDPLAPSHGESLADQSFQSLKSKEIRDSMSPTEMKFQSMALNNPNNTGWNVQSSSEVTPDGRGFRAETIATTDGVENINGGTAEFKGRNEQRSSAMHEGDDKNFRKQASESSKTHLQEKVVIGDENSGRTEIRTSSSTSTSSSKVFQSSSTTEYENGQPVAGHHQPQYLMDSNRGAPPQRMQHEPQYPYEQQPRHQQQQQPQYHPQPTQYEPQYEPQEVRRATDQQQYTQQTEQYNRNRHETNTSQNVQTNETHEQNKRYVDMDKASPEYQRHVQHLMAQPGEIISNTVEYPKPNVKMITTVKRLPDGTIVRNKRYETEETSPTSSSTPVQHTTNTRQTVTNQNTQRRDSQTHHQQEQPKNYQGHAPSERLRRPNDDVVDNVDNTHRYTHDDSVETKYSTVKTSNRKFSTETTSETIQEYDDGYSPSTPSGSRPKAVTNDFSTHGFPSVRPNKPTQEFATDRPQAVTNDFSTHGFPSVRPNKPTQEFATDRPQPQQMRPNQSSPSQRMTSPPKETLVPVRGEYEPSITERRIPTEDGEVIIVSSEKKRSVKHQTNSERIIETDIRSTDDNRYQQITDVTNKTNNTQDFSTHGFPSAREPQTDIRQLKPHSSAPGYAPAPGSTPGYPSSRPGYAPAPGSTPVYPSSGPGPNDDDVIVTSQKTHSTKYNTNTERIIETEILGDDGRPLPRGTPRSMPADVEYITDRYTVTTPGGDQIPQPEYPAAGRPSPSRDFSTQGFPSARSPNKSQPDYSTQGFPSARDTHRPSGTAGHPQMSPTKTQPSPSAPTNRKPTPTMETTERIIQKEKEVDAAHRAFAASLRSSSPVDQTRRDSTSTDGPRHTPRSSVSSTKTFRREVREGSHDSETSRVSTTTVTRQTPPRSVGGRTVVVSERITSSPSPRGTKSPSPGKTVSTTTTTTPSRTATSKPPVKDVPKPDNQHTTTTKPKAHTTTTTTTTNKTNSSDSIFPINHDSLTTITKKTISDNQSNNQQLPLQEVVEEPCIKKHYSLLGPSDHIATTATTASKQESSPRSSPAPSSRSSPPYPPSTKSKSPLVEEDVETIPKKHTSRPLSPSSFTSSRSQPTRPIGSKDVPKQPTHSLHPHGDNVVPDDRNEPRTIDREATFEQIDETTTVTRRKPSRDSTTPNTFVDDDVFISEDHRREDVDAIRNVKTKTKQLISHEREPVAPRSPKTVSPKKPHEVQRIQTEVSKRIDKFEELRRNKQSPETKQSPKPQQSPKSAPIPSHQSPRKSLTQTQPTKSSPKPNESPKTKGPKQPVHDQRYPQGTDNEPAGGKTKPQPQLHATKTPKPNEKETSSRPIQGQSPQKPESHSPTRRTEPKNRPGQPHSQSPERRYPSEENKPKSSRPHDGSPERKYQPHQGSPDRHYPLGNKDKPQSQSPSRISPHRETPERKQPSETNDKSRPLSPTRPRQERPYEGTSERQPQKGSPDRHYPLGTKDKPQSQSPSRTSPHRGTPERKSPFDAKDKSRPMSPSRGSHERPYHGTPERQYPGDEQPHQGSPGRYYPSGTKDKPKSHSPSRTSPNRGTPEQKHPSDTKDKPRPLSPTRHSNDRPFEGKPQGKYPGDEQPHQGSPGDEQPHQGSPGHYYPSGTKDKPKSHSPSRTSPNRGTPEQKHPSDTKDKPRPLSPTRHSNDRPFEGKPQGKYPADEQPHQGSPGDEQPHQGSPGRYYPSGTNDKPKSHSPSRTSPNRGTPEQKHPSDSKDKPRPLSPTRHSNDRPFEGKPQGKYPGDEQPHQGSPGDDQPYQGSPGRYYPSGTKDKPKSHSPSRTSPNRGTPEQKHPSDTKDKPRPLSPTSHNNVRPYDGAPERQYPGEDQPQGTPVRHYPSGSKDEPQSQPTSRASPNRGTPERRHPSDTKDKPTMSPSRHSKNIPYGGTPERQYPGEDHPHQGTPDRHYPSGTKDKPQTLFPSRTGPNRETPEQMHPSDTRSGRTPESQYPGEQPHLGTVDRHDEPQPQLPSRRSPNRETPERKHPSDMKDKPRPLSPTSHSNERPYDGQPEQQYPGDKQPHQGSPDRHYPSGTKDIQQPQSPSRASPNRGTPERKHPSDMKDKPRPLSPTSHSNERPYDGQPEQQYPGDNQPHQGTPDRPYPSGTKDRQQPQSPSRTSPNRGTPERIQPSQIDDKPNSRSPTRQSPDKPYGGSPNRQYPENIRDMPMGTEQKPQSPSLTRRPKGQSPHQPSTTHPQQEYPSDTEEEPREHHTNEITIQMSNVKKTQKDIDTLVQEDHTFETRPQQPKDGSEPLDEHRKPRTNETAAKEPEHPDGRKPTTRTSKPTRPSIFETTAEQYIRNDRTQIVNKKNIKTTINEQFIDAERNQPRKMPEEPTSDDGEPTSKSPSKPREAKPTPCEYPDDKQPYSTNTKQKPEKPTADDRPYETKPSSKSPKSGPKAAPSPKDKKPSSRSPTRPEQVESDFEPTETTKHPINDEPSHRSPKPEPNKFTSTATTTTIHEKFIEAERGHPEHPDGAFVSKSPEEPTSPPYPTYVKKGTTRRDTFEDRCRQILGMENYGNTPGEYKKRPNNEIEEEEEQQTVTTTKERTLFDVKIEDCEDDDEPLSINSVKKVLVTSTVLTSDDDNIPKRPSNQDKEPLRKKPTTQTTKKTRPETDSEPEETMKPTSKSPTSVVETTQRTPLTPDAKPKKSPRDTPYESEPEDETRPKDSYYETIEITTKHSEKSEFDVTKKPISKSPTRPGDSPNKPTKTMPQEKQPKDALYETTEVTEQKRTDATKRITSKSPTRLNESPERKPTKTDSTRRKTPEEPEPKKPIGSEKYITTKETFYRTPEELEPESDFYQETIEVTTKYAEITDTDIRKRPTEKSPTRPVESPKRPSKKYPGEPEKVKPTEGRTTLIKTEKVYRVADTTTGSEPEESQPEDYDLESVEETTKHISKTTVDITKRPTSKSPTRPRKSTEEPNPKMGQAYRMPDTTTDFEPRESQQRPTSKSPTRSVDSPKRQFPKTDAIPSDNRSNEPEESQPVDIYKETIDVTTRHIERTNVDVSKRPSSMSPTRPVESTKRQPTKTDSAPKRTPEEPEKLKPKTGQTFITTTEEVHRSSLPAPDSEPDDSQPQDSYRETVEVTTTHTEKTNKPSSKSPTRPIEPTKRYPTKPDSTIKRTPEEPGRNKPKVGQTFVTTTEKTFRVPDTKSKEPQPNDLKKPTSKSPTRPGQKPKATTGEPKPKPSKPKRVGEPVTTSDSEPEEVEEIEVTSKRIENDITRKSTHKSPTRPEVSPNRRSPVRDDSKPKEPQKKTTMGQKTVTTTEEIYITGARTELPHTTSDSEPETQRPKNLDEAKKPASRSPTRSVSPTYGSTKDVSYETIEVTNRRVDKSQIVISTSPTRSPETARRPLPTKSQPETKAYGEVPREPKGPGSKKPNVIEAFITTEKVCVTGPKKHLPDSDTEPEVTETTYKTNEVTKQQLSSRSPTRPSEPKLEAPKKLPQTSSKSIPKKPQEKSPVRPKSNVNEQFITTEQVYVTGVKKDFPITTSDSEPDTKPTYCETLEVTKKRTDKTITDVAKKPGSKTPASTVESPRKQPVKKDTAKKPTATTTAKKPQDKEPLKKTPEKIQVTDTKTDSDSEAETRENYCETIEITKRRVDKDVDIARKPTTRSSPTKPSATSESPKRTPAKSTTAKQNVQDDHHVTETTSIKERLRSSTRPKDKSPKKKPDQVDAGSSPETSPTRHTERRRSSNISVNTEIIIEHTESEVISAGKKPEGTPKKPKDSVFKEIIDSTTLPEKLPRKMPVTERKESAPVHRVTRKDKDTKMSRSTSENLMNVPKKPAPTPNNLTPASAKTSPNKPSADHRRPNKCFATKTINLSTTDRLISSEDMENVIIDIQHAKSSREPSPDKIVPTPVPAHLDTGKPRYPDVVQEPEDEPRRKPVIKNIPIFEEEHNTYVGCHITEVNRKTYERTDIDIEEDLLSTPVVEAPSSLDYPTTADKNTYPTATVISDDECLMSVHDKVSKFQKVAEEVTKPKTSSPFHREFDDNTRVADNDECLLTVDEKVDKFIKTAESLTQKPITPSPSTTATRDPTRQRPHQRLIDETDEDLDTTECKFTTVKLAPTEPQKSPELVRHISRHISRQSDVGEPITSHTHETHEEYASSSTQEFVTHQQKPSPAVKPRRPANNDDDHDDAKPHDDDEDNDELIPHTPMHTIRLEERRQKDILTRPSVFDKRGGGSKQPPSQRVDSKPQPTMKNVLSSPTTTKDSEKSPQPRTSVVKTRAKPDTSKPTTTVTTTSTTNITTTSNGMKKRQPQQQQTQSPQQRRVHPDTSDGDYRRPVGNNVEQTTTTTTKSSVIKSSTNNNRQPTKPFSINGPKKSPQSQPQPLPSDSKKRPESSRPSSHAPLHTTTTRKNLKPVSNARDDNDSDDHVDDSVDYEEFEVEVVANDSETELIINSGTTRRSTATKTTINKTSDTGKPSIRGKEPSRQPQHTSPPSRKMKEIPPGSTSSPTPSSPPTKSTKEHPVVNLTERSSTLNHNTNTTTTRKSSEPNESFPETRPPIKKTPTPYAPKTKGITTTDSVAARRSLFENHQSPKSPATPKRPTPTSSPSTGRRPSYMDHTKSSLEHIRRDSLELNKNNYSRRPSDGDYEGTQTPNERNSQVKFEVSHHRHRPDMPDEDINIEEIFELTILERLLETVTSYELRRRIRAQIRLVKKNLSNVERNTATTTNKQTNLPERSHSPRGKAKPHTIESHVSTTSRKHLYREEYSEEEHRSSTSTHTSPDRGQIRVTKITRASPSDRRSPSPQNKTCGRPHDRSPSPVGKTHSQEYTAVETSTKKHYTYKNGEEKSRRPMQYYPIDDDVDEEVQRKETSPTVRRPHHGQPENGATSPGYRRSSRKSVSPSSSPERHQVDNSKYAPRSGSPQEKRPSQPRVGSKSPDNRSGRYEQSPVTSKPQTKRTPTTPITSKAKPESKAPVWADRKNVLKSPGNSTSTTPTSARKPIPATDSRITSSSVSRTIKSSTNQSLKHSTTNKSSYVEDDCITSSYGIGPTDENGLPLFGIRALKKKKQPVAEPCETTEEVTGYVVEEKYYSDNKSKPIVERKELIYSTNPDELKAIKERVKDTSVKSIKSERLEGYDDEDSAMYATKTTTTSVRSSPEDFLETKYVRRGSVKEMSEKFIHKESSSSVSEKVNNYPKAGLILRTNSRKQSRDNNEGMDDGNGEYYETRTQYLRDSGEDDECQMETSGHFIVESESETESIKKTQRAFKKITSTKSSSSRSFLNTKGEEKVVTSVDDVLDRMRNADNVVEEGDTAEDQEARALLNKFLGASIIMKGVESTIPINRETKIITTTTTAGGKQPVEKHEVKTTRVTKSIRSGSSSSPVIETTCDIEEIWDEEILKQLLEQAKSYEERRKIRSRLRELMADRTVTTRTVSGTGPKTVSPFAKFKQLDRQSSQQSTKSPTTPTTPGGGSSASPSASGNAPMFKFTDPALNARAATVKEQLLQWCQSKTKEYENVQITNFSSSWVDGLAFCALIHHFLPDAFDYSQLTPKNRRHNFELAFTVADEKAGIAPLLDVEDMVVMKRPDWKCVFVYVQSIYRRFRNCQ
ncbi:titin isoform X6 [Stomoxys calcitrans]|uniref:titin isoform X6 n=1 Tax=Stomoxys calcitrans TaxID=35570 RepID=UPI0027E284FC|nr:titin isoform X6 [Stomoxys calcitrans]